MDVCIFISTYQIEKTKINEKLFLKNENVSNFC